MRRSLLLATAALGGAAMLLGARGGQVSLGDRPEYKFEAMPDNGLGVKSLEALRGKPVLIEFWGTY
jgi:hypothetical protein